MSGDWDDDDIGYGKPPRWTRFEKGRSGNPKGRPKKVKDPEPARAVLIESEADRALRRELDRKIRVTDVDGTKEVTMADALVRTQVTKAAQGHVTAIRDVRKAQKELEKAEAEKARIAAEQAAEEKKIMDEERESTFRYVCQLKEQQSAAWAEALSKGKAEPTRRFPHPDDITINHVEKTFSIRGPVSEETLPAYEYFKLLRDQYFVHLIVCMRTRDKAERAKSKFCAIMLGVFDAALPKRWAIVDDFEQLAWAFLQMPMQFLRDDLARTERRAAAIMPIDLRQPVRQCEEYKTINEVMKPLLKPMGYVSYAQFERAYEDTGGDPPWPRQKARGVKSPS